ncbi:hypothetical protein ACFYNY_05000 [Streptomyces sp. NPDC006530]|uniref:hypothetical protein n=1 Tax=Streptomyces sp. NPDC006530 TaxID=3364750 RepID=UPI00368C1C13
MRPVIAGARAVAALALVPAGFLAAGCGIQSTDVIAVGDPASAQAMPGDNATVLYFTGPDGLMPVVREGAPKPPLPLLFAGPDQDERAAGLGTELPSAQGALKMSVSGSTVTVVLGQDVSRLTPLAQRQIACTALQAVVKDRERRVMINGTGGPSSLSPLACPA